MSKETTSPDLDLKKQKRKIKKTDIENTTWDLEPTKQRDRNDVEDATRDLEPKK